MFNPPPEHKISDSLLVVTDPMQVRAIVRAKIKTDTIGAGVLAQPQARPFMFLD